ncbi:MAG: AMP-dependent synthetase [Myxococcaceae bacterium]|nr:MAG: AMP-dependent synthetase [Myxococcaceae bacterium]
MEALRDVTGWARVLARVAVRSELVAGASPEATLLAARLLGTGRAGISTIFRVRAVGDARRPAFVWRGRTIDFATADDRIDRLAAGLRRRGLKRRDAVALVLRNRPEFFEIEGAMARLGGSSVSVSWRSTPAELRYLLEHSGAKAVFFEHDLADVVEEAVKGLPTLPRDRLFAVDGDAPGMARYDDVLDARKSAEADEEDGAVVIYTSGTTGRPKGAVRRFGAGQVLGFAAFLERVPMRRSDRHLCVCPLYHSTGLGFASMSLMVGGAVVLEPDFEPMRFLRTVERERITTTALVPTMLHRLMALDPDVIRGHSTRSLRVMACGGAQLPAPLARRALGAFGDVLYNFYGATETGLVTVATPDDLRALPGTIGRALHGVSIRLLDASGAEVPTGEVGELYARSTMLVEGYHADDGATRSSMRDGHFSVGDLATVDEAGRYMIVGRRRDMVISGGVNVYPAEVEALIDAHPAVAQAAVVGVADEEWGERLRAFVVLRDSVTDEPRAVAQELRRWCRERASGAKVPREWVFVEALPSNPTGKVLKRELRDWQGEAIAV